MVQNDGYADLLTSLLTVDEVLDGHAPELGHDLIGYRNHVYRVGRAQAFIDGWWN
jgi:hypothetical protein